MGINEKNIFMDERNHWSVIKGTGLITLRSNWAPCRAISFRNWDEVYQIAQLLLGSIPKANESPVEEINDD